MAQQLQHSRGISKHGRKTNVFDKELANRIRKRLKLTEKELPDKAIRKVTKLANAEIGKWIVENADGYKMHKNMGMISVSKQLPKEYRENREETIEKIKTIPVSELQRAQIMRSYGVEVGTMVDKAKLNELRKFYPQMNLSTFFYNYYMIWFNHRNCDIRKAQIYRFKPKSSFIRDMYKNAVEGKDYWEQNFHDHYRWKLYPKW